MKKGPFLPENALNGEPKRKEGHDHDQDPLKKDLLHIWSSCVHNYNRHFPLNSPEFCRIFPDLPKLAPIPQNPVKFLGKQGGLGIHAISHSIWFIRCVCVFFLLRPFFLERRKLTSSFSETPPR